MTDELQDATWRVLLKPSGMNGLEPVVETVTAAYHRIAEQRDFIEFKDERHKIVYMVACGSVISIRRD
jgi:hypothetical protein